MYKKYNFVKNNNKTSIKNIHGNHVDFIRMRADK
jgi:hypothetical protein